MEITHRIYARKWNLPFLKLPLSLLPLPLSWESSGKLIWLDSGKWFRNSCFFPWRFYYYNVIIMTKISGGSHKSVHMGSPTSIDSFTNNSQIQVSMSWKHQSWQKPTTNEKSQPNYQALTQLKFRERNSVKSFTLSISTFLPCHWPLQYWDETFLDLHAQWSPSTSISFKLFQGRLRIHFQCNFSSFTTVICRFVMPKTIIECFYTKKNTSSTKI